MKKRRDLMRFLGRPLRDLVVKDVSSRPGKKISRGQVAKDFLPIPEAAGLLSVTRRQVYDLIAGKKLRVVTITWPSGYRVRWVTRRSVERYSMERYSK